jgi:hypothetical protein
MLSSVFRSRQKFFETNVIPLWENGTTFQVLYRHGQDFLTFFALYGAYGSENVIWLDQGTFRCSRHNIKLDIKSES